MKRTIVCSIASFIVVVASDARAQAVMPPYGDDVPAVEIGATADVIVILGPGPVGLRVTRNISPWLAVEGGAERQAEPSLVPAYTMLSIGARMTAREWRSGGAVFLSLGAARAFGLQYHYSPMITVGTQTPWYAERLAVRLDYQFLPHGQQKDYDRSRLMVSAVLGL